MTNCGTSFLTKVIHRSEVRSVKLLSWDQSQQTTNRAMYQLLKILTAMIGHTVEVLNVASTRIYTNLVLIVNFKLNACKK